MTVEPAAPYPYWLGWLRAVVGKAVRYLDEGRPQAAREELRRGLAEVEKALAEVEPS